ncbi:MAG: hypothetical protein ACI9E1_001121 [Cryomorphaceae bacterium]|jgi:hypothetical protein
MISSYVVTQNDMEAKTVAKYSVGLASYGVDDWPSKVVSFPSSISTRENKMAAT